MFCNPFAAGDHAPLIAFFVFFTWSFTRRRSAEPKLISGDAHK
jgi:hypothetical protein